MFFFKTVREQSFRACDVPCDSETARPVTQVTLGSQAIPCKQMGLGVARQLPLEVPQCKCTLFDALQGKEEKWFTTQQAAATLVVSAKTSLSTSRASAMAMPSASFCGGRVKP